MTSHRPNHMKRFAIIVVVALAPSVALAQSAGNEPPPAMDSNEAVIATSNVVSGSGIKVGEGTVLYPSVGLFTGIVSNVFFEETAGSTAGVLRLLVELGAGSLSSARLALNSQPEDQSAPGTGAPAMTQETMNQDFQ